MHDLHSALSEQRAQHVVQRPRDVTVMMQFVQQASDPNLVVRLADVDKHGGDKVMITHPSAHGIDDGGEQAIHDIVRAALFGKPELRWGWYAGCVHVLQESRHVDALIHACEDGGDGDGAVVVGIVNVTVTLVQSDDKRVAEGRGDEPMSGAD